MRYAITETSYRSVPDSFAATDLADGETLADALPARLLQDPIGDQIAFKRYERETAGITTAGYTVFTDRPSQMKLTSVALRASQDSSYSVDWKLTDGTFVTLTGAQITAIANAVGDYVQACYTREATLLAAVAAGTFTEEMLNAQVGGSSTEGWPAQG